MIRPRDVAGPAVVAALVVVAWYALAYRLPNNFSPATGKPLIIPPPHRLFEDLNEVVRGRIATGLAISARTSVVGLSISMVLGVLVGILMSRARWMERALWPYLVALQVTPIIALVPLIIKIVGANFAARVTVTVVITFFPIVSSTLFGLRGVGAALHDLFTLGGARRSSRLLLLELPAAAPAILNGFRTSAGLAVIGAIVGDFFFARGEPGLGRLVTLFFQNNQAGPMFVTAACASALGFILFVVFGWLNRILVGSWHEGRPNT
jgi:NitT/TauT family transport system permease protein